MARQRPYGNRSPRLDATSHHRSETLRLNRRDNRRHFFSWSEPTQEPEDSDANKNDRPRVKSAIAATKTRARASDHFHRARAPFHTAQQPNPRCCASQTQSSRNQMNG